MKIGIFDSGLGGLVVLRSMLRSKLKYDFIFLGDTKNLPYGNKSERQVFRLATKALEYLFKGDCGLVIVACNTVSSEALRKIQQKWLPNTKFKDRKVLGVIRPTVEEASMKSKIVGVIGTNRTIDSKAYLREFKSYNLKLKVYQQKTPLLVPVIESGNLQNIDELLEHYLKPLRQKNIDTLILGCTHYGLIKPSIQKKLPKKVKVIAQEDLLPAKLVQYLIRHKEIEKKLSKSGKIELLITKANLMYPKLAKVIKI